MVEIIREKITTTDAWVGPDVQDDPRWLYQLTQEDLQEIDDALQATKAAGSQIPFSADDFPLPTFKARLDELMERVSMSVVI